MNPLMEVLLTIVVILAGVGLFFGTIFVCINHFVPWYEAADVSYEEERYYKVHLTMVNPRLGISALGEGDTYWEARISAQDRLYKLGRKEKQRLTVERKKAKLAGESVPGLHQRWLSKRELRRISKGQF